MRRRGTAALLACLVVAAAGATGVPPVSAATYGSDLERFEADRTDEVTGAQVHVVYAIPSDGKDRALDTDGTLRGTVTSFQTWLESKTGGRGLRLDTFSASRVGVRTYSFTGRVYPALNNRLVNLYRNGVLAAQGRSDASGIYRITKTLAGGTFTFQVRTPNDQSNLGTKSRELRLLIS